VLLQGKLWKPGAFLSHASRDTAFWSFYFGLAGLSTGLALLLALLTRRKLAWLLCLFSSTYLLVACIQGYVDWLMGPSTLHLQHYMTSVLTLTSYGCLFWMCSEALNTREYVPRLHRLVMTIVALIFLSLASIPLNLYGTAIHLQFILCALGVVILGGASLHGLGRHHRTRVERGFSLAAIWYLVTALVALLTLFGAIPFHENLYALWQYGLVVNTLIVLTLIIINSINEEKLERTRLQLAHDLRVSREARFHQRQFMGMVAHEFRTPLAIISAALENLKSPQLDPAHRRPRETNIARANERLIQLTDNCLADSRLDAAHLQLEYQPTDIHNLIDDASSIARLSPDHHLDIQVERPNGVGNDELTEQVQTDPGLFRIALSNLLDNAVKYSRRGAIRVRAFVDRQYLTISVCDPGPGIPTCAVGELFERFQRGQQDRSGVGLGLYVAREIVRAHGGDLVLAHNTSTGCCFELTVPCGETGSESD
jgi:signal transduction histidine kinase